MKITQEQRESWAEKTAQSPFNLWLADQTKGEDGRFDLEKLYEIAQRHSIDKISSYSQLNPGQQRMNLGNALRSRVDPAVYAAYATPSVTRAPQVFATRFWGFDPQTNPFAGFTYEGSRAALLSRARPGDLIAVVGTSRDPTSELDRGKLLGLLEFQHTPMQAEDLVPEGVQLPDRLFENGRFRWPYAVPAIRAWRFEQPQLVREVIGRQLTMAATTGVDRLAEEEALAILALPLTEIELPPSRAKVRDERLGKSSQPKLDPNMPGQPGPQPSEWSAIISHADGPTATYLMQFGEDPIWKIGISQNTAQRLKCLNFSVPSEVLGGRCWSVVLQHRWQDGMAAYKMEQALLKKLEDHLTSNERVQAPKSLIDRAWQDYLMGRL